MESFGFKRTEETTTETDENGNIVRSKSINYQVTDDCTKVKYWEGILAQRLGKGWRKRSSKMVREVKTRIAGKNTKQCEFGVEFQLKDDSQKNGENDAKRGWRFRVRFRLRVRLRVRIRFRYRRRLWG